MPETVPPAAAGILGIDLGKYRSVACRLAEDGGIAFETFAAGDPAAEPSGTAANETGAAGNPAIRGAPRFSGIPFKEGNMPGERKSKNQEKTGLTDGRLHSRLSSAAAGHR